MVVEWGQWRGSSWPRLLRRDRIELTSSKYVVTGWTGMDASVGCTLRSCKLSPRMDIDELRQLHHQAVWSQVLGVTTSCALDTLELLCV